MERSRAKAQLLGMTHGSLQRSTVLDAKVHRRSIRSHVNIDRSRNNYPLPATTRNPSLGGLPGFHPYFPSTVITLLRIGYCGSYSIWWGIAAVVESGTVDFGLSLSQIHFLSPPFFQVTLSTSCLDSPQLPPVVPSPHTLLSDIRPPALAILFALVPNIARPPLLLAPPLQPLQAQTHLLAVLRYSPPLSLHRNRHR
ncbi:hypothetical protein K491DRAFT_216762 [Lophiostoma macrostomum CBS 122681]|uniref:Uncharacterized protein n=1 Tax=Lophiostoma macrostomum CBS 122681 TaxID=1314788 RepID=A0A6A6TKM3_9PLEO|nr:hypothetical protein K491DRAFT_216762 [Lophiostoma macrostomum CBS 122681]